ncbi:hypothetical protein AAFF_G00363360 [Aldrovandia affinis]|uniref:Amino acid permease N-terminal domain-containing protein n=1 Tax=Aldrovandia affinis TaxID=143900 RepID=A0AAD7R780_9TELE|nr:hypothetical protein AAFF_G00363360 [Aldrovandia affinis]
MGQQTSSLQQPISLQHGRFSVSEEAPPLYSCSHGDGHPDNTSNFHLGNNNADDSHVLPTVVAVEMEAWDGASERRDSRRPSIYSTMDAVPQLDFYTNATATGRQRRTRLSWKCCAK